MAKSREVGIRLSVKDADKAKADMAKFGKEGADALKRIEAAGRPATVSLQALNAASGSVKAGLAGFASGAVSALVPTLSLAAALQGAKAALDEFGQISDSAKASGLDAEFFQGIAYQAKLAGVELDGTAGALQTFAKNAGLAAEGKGKLVGALQALNPELLKNIQLATTQEERVKLAAEALSRTTDAATKAALATALFGEQGAKLASAFDGGAAAIDQTMQKAKDLGIIIDRETIAKADELGDKFDTATKIIDTRMKQALVNLAPALVYLANLTADWTRSLNIVLDQFSAIEDRVYVRPLQNELAEFYNSTLFPLKDQIAELREQLAGNGPNKMILKLDLTEAEKKLAEAEAYANRLLSRITELQGRTSIPAAPYASSDGTQASNPNLMGGADLDVLNVSGISRASNVASRAKETINQTIDLMAGIDRLGSTIEGVKDDTVSISSQIVSAADSWANSLSETLASAFRTGKFEWKGLFQTILADVAALATQQLITNPLQALIGGIAGALFSPSAASVRMPQLYAEGTDYHPGGLAIVGERGPELLNLPRGSQVIPNHKLGGSSVQVNATYNISGSGLQPAQLLAVMEEHDRRLMALVSDRVKKDMKNGVFG